MKLLSTTKPAELPKDALLARLRARRHRLDLVDGTFETTASQLINWVYSRLNRRLRRQLEPFLNLLAMRNLILALRYTLVSELPASILLNDSLLGAPFKKLLTEDQDPDSVINQLEALLLPDYPFAAGLSATYRSQGPGGVEQQLTEGILQHSLTSAHDSSLVQTLRYLVDMRNVLLVSKFWRWQVNQDPRLVSGGILAPEILKRVWAERDSDRLARLVTRRTGVSETTLTTPSLEQHLLKGLSRLLHRAGRDPLGLSVITEYLWLAQLAKHNQILRKTLETDRETLLEEVMLL